MRPECPSIGSQRRAGTEPGNKAGNKVSASTITFASVFAGATALAMSRSWTITDKPVSPGDMLKEEFLISLGTS